MKTVFPGAFSAEGIRAPLVVGRGVEAVSSASITIASATRAINDGARLVARRRLAPGAVKR